MSSAHSQKIGGSFCSWAGVSMQNCGMYHYIVPVHIVPPIIFVVIGLTTVLDEYGWWKT